MKQVFEMNVPLQVSWSRLFHRMVEQLAAKGGVEFESIAMDILDSDVCEMKRLIEKIGEVRESRMAKLNEDV